MQRNHDKTLRKCYENKRHAAGDGGGCVVLEPSLSNRLSFPCWRWCCFVYCIYRLLLCFNGFLFTKTISPVHNFQGICCSPHALLILVAAASSHSRPYLLEASVSLCCYSYCIYLSIYLLASVQFAAVCWYIFILMGFVLNLADL